jgi:lysophospholipase L1-like esterase
LALASLVVAGVLALLDLVVARTLEPKVIDRVVDIQTESTLKAKLDRLAKFRGRKVALVGDSVVLGLTLKDTGDPQWESKTLTAQLQRQLEEAYPGEPVLVSNLALNGALPADLDRLIELILPTRPDVIVFDVGLRGFSGDFSAPGSIHSRDWLQRPDSASKRHGINRYTTSVGARIDRNINEPLRRHWRVFNLRDLAAQAMLGGDLRQYLVRQRENLRTKLASLYEEPLDDLGADELELVLKARTRFDTVQLNEDHPQRKALTLLLARLREVDQPTFIFYSRENPELRDQVIRTDRYYELRTELDSLITSNLGPRMYYDPGVSTLDTENYLDLVHVDAEGFRRMLEAFWPEIARLLANKE